ncbi:MAG: hypothetical protein KDC71_13765 [Acidobacteria bacterium]|nr:hypothetical protein [Acidobacteriota bacterium]
MIGVLDLTAVLCGPMAGLEGAEFIPAVRSDRELGPAAVYALRAVEALCQKRPELQLETLPFCCVSGHPGAPVSAFEKAWHLANGGPLIGPGFAETRYRRIHPFTLLTSLYNQVPAALSSKLGMTGPCHNVFEGGGNWSSLLALFRTWAQPQCLLVLSSANQREEEAVRNAALWPNAQPLEGAIAILLDAQAPFQILPNLDLPADKAERAFRNPVLDLALQLVTAFQTKQSHGRLVSWNERGVPFSLLYKRLVS